MNELATSPAMRQAAARRSGFWWTVVHVLRVIIESRANYYAAYVFDVACPFVLAWLGMQYATDWSIPLLSVCAGLFVFSFIEYAIHRWAFHTAASFMTPIHLTHHQFPTQPSALPFFTSPGSSLILWAVLSMFFPQQFVFFFLCGVLAAYFCYAVVHHLEHAIRIRSLPFAWLQNKWAAHAIHHGRNDVNFGVTTSLWDRVLGTHHQSKTQRRIVA